MSQKYFTSLKKNLFKPKILSIQKEDNFEYKLNNFKNEFRLLTLQILK